MFLVQKLQWQKRKSDYYAAQLNYRINCQNSRFWKELTNIYSLIIQVFIYCWSLGAPDDFILVYHWAAFTSVAILLFQLMIFI